MVPECPVAGFGNSVQAVSTAVMQGGTKGGLAGGNAQQQGFGSCAMAPEVNQCRTDHITAQFAGSDTHKALETSNGRRYLKGALAAGGSTQARRKRIKPLELKCSVIFAL
jgi:hypothetical protein